MNDAREQGFTKEDADRRLSFGRWRNWDGRTSGRPSM